jgi:hypothetical protein
VLVLILSLFTKQWHDTILMCGNKLFKMAHFTATITTIVAEETTKLFINNILNIMVFLKNCLGDQDTWFH